MKSKTLPLMAALMGPVLALSGISHAQPPQENLTKVYEAGRAAFNKGDLATAKIAFAKVLKAKPEFDLAKIYMAQIRTAEAKWEARPRSLKIAEKSSVADVVLTDVTLADALEVVRRELEKSGGGPEAGRIALHTDLSADSLERPVQLAVKQMPMQDFVNAIAFAGDVRIAWHADGLSVTAATSNAIPDAAAEAATREMKKTAQSRTIPHLKLENLSAPEAWKRLQHLADPLQGPLIVIREPNPAATVTLDLRQVPVAEAIRSVALVCGQEVSWHPWGAGVYVKATVAAVNPPAAANPANPNSHVEP